MKLILFVLADSVEIYGGKMVIAGIFDKFVVDEIPTFTRPIALAFKIKGEKKDYGKTYDDTRLLLRKTNSKKSLFEVKLPITFAKPADEAGTNSVGVIHTSSLKFISLGKYVFELKVASKVIGSTSFFVVKSQKKATKKKAKKKAKKPKKKSATNKAS